MESALGFLCGWLKDGLLRGILALASVDDTFRTLQKEMRELRGERDDVRREVDEAEMGLLECRGAVKEWLNSVEELDRRVSTMTVDFDRRSGCAGICSPWGWWSNYELAVRAAGKLEEARDLRKKKGELGAVAQNPLPPAVVELPLPEIAGGASRLEEVLRHVGRDEVKVLGIHGPEGVGKTILLKRVNNSFALEACGFHVVIFVDISQNSDVERIQDEISDRIGLQLTEAKRAKALYRALSRRTFLLLLDDVRQELDLDVIGIPLPTVRNRCKIVLTARDEQVCVQMGAQQRVSVDTLEEDEAWKLFCISVGSNELLDSPTVRSLARAIVRNCRGLPLAIVTMGKAMAIKRSPLEWERAAVGQEIPEKIQVLVGPPISVICGPSDDFDKQQENEDLLMTCITQPLGFTVGRPIAACLIYKCLSHWGNLEADQARLFDLVIQTITNTVEKHENRGALAYWLSNVFTLLLLIRQALKPSDLVDKGKDHYVGTANVVRRISRVIIPLLGVTSGEDSSCQVETNNMSCRAKTNSPVLRFKQELTACAEKIYGLVRDDLKQELSPLLKLVIQAARTRSSSGRFNPNATAAEASLAHWPNIVNSLENFLKTMKDNYVAPVLVRKMFMQIFSFIDVQLFNSFLLRRECCSLSNGEYIRGGLSDLELWCVKTTDEFAGLAWDELIHVRLAASFLVIRRKSEMTFDELAHEYCPSLSVQQLYRIISMHWDDKFNTRSVSPNVLSTLRVQMQEENENSGSFLLDEDLSVPFSVDELSKSVGQIEVPYIEPPQLLQENPHFVFLFLRLSTDNTSTLMKHDRQP